MESGQKTETVWDKLAREQREALQLARQYKAQSRKKPDPETTLTMWEFWVAHSDLADAKVMLRLLPAISDVDMVCTLNPKSKLPMKVIKEIERRLAPRGESEEKNQTANGGKSE